MIDVKKKKGGGGGGGGGVEVFGNSILSNLNQREEFDNYADIQKAMLPK